jgi:hypothetical protein
MSYRDVGKVWTPATLKEYLTKVKRPAWCKAVTLHHTAYPDLKMRPHGWKVQRMRNLQSYYQNTRKWKAGPHLFTDEDQIFGLSPMTSPGTHARKYNGDSIGVEVLGNYDVESPKSGRGLKCWKTTAEATAVLLDWLGKKPSASTVRFHRDNGITRKSCPGKKVQKDWILGLIKGTSVSEPVVEPPKAESEDRPKIPGWNKFVKINGRWYVPALDFLDHIGGNRATLIKKMKSENGKFVYDDEIIEGAFHDREKKTTMAPALELMGF